MNQLTWVCYDGLAGQDAAETFHALPSHDIFTGFNSNLKISITLRIPWRGSDVLKVPVIGILWMTRASLLLLLLQVDQRQLG